MVLGILGIVITVICTFIPIFLTRRDRTIRYWQIEAESIFTNKIKEIKNLAIFYNNKEISDDVIILKTVIENNGKNDIDKSTVYKPICITFDDNYRLLDYELLKAPEGVSLNSIDNGIECKWDLFKKNEFIVLKIMLKKNSENIKNKDLLTKYTDIACRITNIEKIKKRSYKNSLTEKPSKTTFLVYFGIAFFYCIIMGILLSSDFYQIRYKSSLLPEQTFYLRAKNNESIILKGTKQTKIININDYNNAKEETEIVLIKENKNIFLILFVIFSIILVFFPFGVALSDYLVDRKVHSFFIDNE